jgi:hypothetical protein
MTIEVERVEILGIDVRNIAAARDLLTRLFGVNFLTTVMGGGVQPVSLPLKRGELRPNPGRLEAPSEVSIDTSGLFELIQSHLPDQPDRVRNIHLKVKNIDDALEQMQREGIGVRANYRIGGLREVIFDPGDLFGMCLCFVEYEGPSLIEAMLASD